jgi:SAM-dependent methyltransferase
MPKAYGDDLAYIHDVGYGDFARDAAPALLRRLRAGGLGGGLVVDLGCGSGIWAEALVSAGYDVLGVDLSPAMIALARARVPGGQFRVGSFVDAALPPCVAVTALGECFSFLVDGANTRRGLRGLFRRVHSALCPGGLLIFDAAGPGRVGRRGPRRTCAAGDDWAVLVSAEEDTGRRLLTRSITSFRKVSGLYRRDHEVHRLRLFTRAELAGDLRGAGFRVRHLAGYGPRRFPRGLFGFLARKPGRPPGRAGG